MRHLDLESLSCFLEVVRLGSISAAARSLRLAQPALTRRIQLLEEQLGDTLLERHRRGVVPTETGRLVEQRGRDLLRNAQELRDEVTSAISKPAGVVRFGFPPSVGSLFVGRILADCIGRYPDIKLHLVENVSPAVREGLIEGSLDMAIMSCRAGHDSLRCVPLFHEQLWLFASPELWDLGDGAVPLSRIGLRRVMLASFLWSHFETKLPLNVIAAVDALPLAREAMLANAGYGIFPFSALEREIARGELHGAPIENLTVSRGLFFRKDRTTSHAMRIVEKLVDNQVGALLKGGQEMYQHISSDDYIV
ncbi:LysR family nitrogen assimilation transcriptional regulator [Bosea sp. OAE752]|uniref:LysR family transcriptional regulator n=1 Tax=Bosea sp. OAE752 TaxID=2663873 RepID=UPI003D221897